MQQLEVSNCTSCSVITAQILLHLPETVCSGTDLEDISQYIALPCSGHIDVAIPIWSVQAGVTAFRGGKIMLPPSVISPTDTVEGSHLLRGALK